MKHIPFSITMILIFSLGLGACTATPASEPEETPAERPESITLYNWEEYMPQSVLDAFTEEYGVAVNYITYDSGEEAIEGINSGSVKFDVAVIELANLPVLVANESVAELNHDNLPNFQNISPNFHDLAFDPGNRFLVPYNWGTTALIVRSDLVEEPITKWADLWDPRFVDLKIGIRALEVETTSIALEALGYSLNSEDPAQLEEALVKLNELKPAIQWVPVSQDDAVGALLSGEIAVLVGWPGDALAAQLENPEVTLVLPEEGAFLWGEGFVISANSPYKETVELFLDFVLRPEMGAEIISELYYPNANEAALEFVDPELATNPIIAPSQEDIANAEWMLPLSPEGYELYNSIWQRFMAEE